MPRSASASRCSAAVCRAPSRRSRRDGSTPSMTKAQRNALIIVALGCVIGVVFGFSLGRTGTTKPNLPAPFVQIYPPLGDLDLRQVEPVIVVRGGYTADL